MTEYRPNIEVNAIADLLISHMPELAYIKEANPSIAYMEADQKKTSAGMDVYADCEKVKPKMKEFMAYDYVITVYGPNYEKLNFNQKQILIYHELLHIDCYRDSEGVLQCATRQHDIQDFHAVVDRFGLYWAQDENVPDILADYLKEE